MKIKEYRGINTKDMSTLERHVETLIRSGFQPFGGISITFNLEDELWFSQAMVKYEKEILELKRMREETKERKLVDFSVNWYPTLDSINRNEKELLDEGWETFKKESVDHNTGLMTHKLMMVKYKDIK